ncbi:dihydroxyacetone kinase family protein [Lacisediminihabitans sp. FW035]
MTRIFDDPAEFADDALDGFVAANERYVARVPGGVVRSTATPEGQVALVVGGGSGHYPAFAGVVGAGLAAGAVCGNIFTSPSAAQAYSVARSANRGGGVIFSFGNYAGDVLHFGEAEQRLLSEGIDARIVLCTDDIASAPISERSKRRGIAGDFVVFKIAGAAAERGLGIDDVERVARSANERTRSLGVAFAGCTLPGESGPLFTVPEGQMSIGLGIHGEPGISEQPIPSAHELASILVTRLLEDVPEDRGSRVALVLNGLGTVKYEELFVLYGHIARLLTEQNIAIVEPECGELVTSLDMAGLSLTLFWLDDELESLWTDAADTPAYRKGTLASGDRIEVEIFSETEITHLDSGEESQRVARLTAELITIAFATVMDNADELGRIDAIAGDGDHGTGMVRGLRAANESAAASVIAEAGVTELLTAAGHSWSDKAGGTSGALWGAALVAAGTRLGDRATYTAADAAEAASSAVEAIMTLGKARRGDKTMVDSMLPFVETLTQAVANGTALPPSLRSAAIVATEAAAATSALRPQLGRARPLAEKSLGHPDAGATSFALIVSRIAEAASALSREESR